MRPGYVPLFAIALAACKFGGEEAHDSPGDPPADAGPPSALGTGSRISQVVSQYAPPDAGVTSSSGPTVDITGAALIIIDSYDETHDGKSAGTVYVEDVPAPGQPLPPFSGIEFYKPTYTPSNLLVAPGNVLDFTGEYTNYAYSGKSSKFGKDEFFPEMYEPTVSFRFDYEVPPPTVIQASDLSATVAAATTWPAFSVGMRWTSMLVEVDDVTILGSYTSTEGRVQLYFSTPGFPNGTGSSDLSFGNQLFALDPTDPDYAMGAKFSKVIGVCTYFFDFQINPRSPADFVK